ARGPPRCAPAGGSPPPAVRPAPANLARVPRAAPDARPDARSALHTAPRARLPALHPRTPAPSPSPCRTALRAPYPTTAATAVLHLRLSFRPSSWHSCSWRPPPLTQPDSPIGRGMPPLKSQQPSGHRQFSVLENPKCIVLFKNHLRMHNRIPVNFCDPYERRNNLTEQTFLLIS